MKKLILIVVDACTPRVLLPAMEGGRLPNLRELAEAGELNPSCVTVFPSITPAATASIVTGRYPHEHHIAGAFWYNEEKDKLVYYAESVGVIYNEGISYFFNDFLLKLNHERLRAETLFQTVERAGLRAACLNYLIFRGDVRHELDVPLLMELWPGVSFSEEAYGPSVMFLGDFVHAGGPGVPARDMDVRGHVWHSYGITDDYTAQVLVRMAHDDALPDFTVAYFPDYDTKSHKVGPENATGQLEQLDARLGEFVAACGGLDRALSRYCVMLTADHAQTDVREDETGSILLQEVLEGFRVADAGGEWDEYEDLMICPNMRVAMIYFQRLDRRAFDKVVSQLLGEPRMDQLMWRGEVLDSSGEGYHVATADRGRLHFWRGGGGPHSARDQQGCEWSWEGDLSAVDGRVEGGRLSFGDYPNAFERIACGLEHEDAGHLWATSRVGHEFRLPRTGIHRGGGSHGSLHRLDSEVPLLLAGAPEGVRLPRYVRTVDVAPLCLRVLGLEPPRAVGSCHATRRGGADNPELEV